MKKVFLSFQEAKQEVQKAGIKTLAQYQKWPKRESKNLPYEIGKCYKSEYKGWEDFITAVEPEEQNVKIVTTKKETISTGSISLKTAIQLCPAIGTEMKLEKLSERYKHVNTQKVIENIIQTMPGWEIISVKETHIRKVELKPFTHHVVKMENPKFAFPGSHDKIQLVISNSHNGVSKFEFYYGIFRMICSNGLVVFDKRFGQINKKHFTDYEEINTYITECVNNVKNLFEVHSQFCKRILTKEEKVDLAIKGLHARYQYKNSYLELMYKQLKERYNIEGLLTPTRDEDQGDSLWTVFNVIQERIMKGFYFAKVDSGLSKANPIKNTHLDIQFNKKFWDYAMELISEK